MKILVVGYSSSGKSTFAKRLSTVCGLPILHIDTISFGPNWVEKESDIVEKEIRKFMQKDGWIIDGQYRNLATERFDISDKIFIFDFNRYKCLYGAIVRRIKYHKQSRDSIASGCTERLNFSFMMWILFTGRRKDSRSLIKSYKKDYKEKVVVFKNRKQTKQYLRSIGYKGSFKYE